MDDLNRHIRELLKKPDFVKSWQESERDYQTARIKANERLRKKTTLKTVNRKLTITGSPR